jgi:hypothetical protein
MSFITVYSVLGGEVAAKWTAKQAQYTLSSSRGNKHKEWCYFMSHGCPINHGVVSAPLINGQYIKM